MAIVYFVLLWNTHEVYFENNDNMETTPNQANKEEQSQTSFSSALEDGNLIALSEVEEKYGISKEQALGIVEGRIRAQLRWDRDLPGLSLELMKKIRETYAISDDTMKSWVKHQLLITLDQQWPDYKNAKWLAENFELSNKEVEEAVSAGFISCVREGEFSDVEMIRKEFPVSKKTINEALYQGLERCIMSQRTDLVLKVKELLQPSNDELREAIKRVVAENESMPDGYITEVEKAVGL